MSDTVDKAVAWDELAKKNAEIARLRGGIHRFLSGDWIKIRKVDLCPHGRFGFEDCGQCADDYFARLLGPEPPDNFE